MLSSGEEAIGERKLNEGKNIKAKKRYARGIMGNYEDGRGLSLKVGLGQLTWILKLCYTLANQVLIVFLGIIFTELFVYEGNLCPFGSSKQL